MGVPRVTALRPQGRSRTSIEVDDRPWRVLDDACIAEAGLSVGCYLTRDRAAALARARRQHRALGTALRVLERRDLSSADLEVRLERRGVPPHERSRTVARLRESGLVDDRRVAHARAAELVGRRLGDAVIADDLLSRGLDRSLVDEALDGLEPESVRAREIVVVRGLSPKTLRYLAQRGFAESTLEPLIDGLGDGTPTM